MAVSWAIPHSQYTDQGGDAKKLIIIAFYGRFMGHFSHFWGPAPFLGSVTTGTRLKGRPLKLVVLAFYGRFVGYFTQFWGPDAISRPRDSQYTD
jgi:hypothetical protein